MRSSENEGIVVDEVQLKVSRPWSLGLVDGFKALSQVEKAYVVGMALCAVAVFVLLAGIERPVVLSIFLLAGLLLCGSLAREAYVFIVRQLEATLSKWLMAPAAVMVSAYSLGSAANIVNMATGQDPGLFPRATAFMAPVAAIPALALLVSVLAGVALLLMFFAWGTQLSSKDRKRSAKAWIWLGRIGGALATLSLISPLAVEKSSFGRFVETAAGWMGQGLDMHVDRVCATGEWDRVLRIDDELVLVAHRTDNGLVFRREECALQSE